MTLPSPHDDLTFHAPLSDARAARLAAFAGAAGGLVVDAGCGWATLLLLTLEHAPAARGMGVDTDESGLRRARDEAAARGLAERVEFRAGDGPSLVPDRADALLCVGARHVWGTDDTSALAALRARLDRGGRLVYADGIWSRPPTVAATEPLGGDPGEFGSLADLVDVAVAAGFRPLDVAEASQEEWDAFESGYSAGYERWLLAHPDDPSAPEVRAKADTHRAAYLRGYRGVLGFAYLQLVAV